MRGRVLVAGEAAISTNPTPSSEAEQRAAAVLKGHPSLWPPDCFFLSVSDSKPPGTRPQPRVGARVGRRPWRVAGS